MWHNESKRLDAIGKKFGRLTVLEPFKEDNKKLKWKCLCDCGNITYVYARNLTHGTTTSCGCYCRQRLSNQQKKHGLGKSRLYSIWYKMVQRCFDSKFKFYNHYGGRGITVCDEWKNDFIKFYLWSLSNGYEEKLTIDRINNNGNYEPSNCRWSTMKEQSNNKRNNLTLAVNGYEMSAENWSKKTGYHPQTLRKYARDNGKEYAERKIYERIKI